jgi:hypothetical protein
MASSWKTDIAVPAAAREPEIFAQQRRQPRGQGAVERRLERQRQPTAQAIGCRQTDREVCSTPPGCTGSVRALAARAAAADAARSGTTTPGHHTSSARTGRTTHPASPTRHPVGADIGG